MYIFVKWMHLAVSLEKDATIIELDIFAGFLLLFLVQRKLHLLLISGVTLFVNFWGCKDYVDLFHDKPMNAWKPIGLAHKPSLIKISSSQVESSSVKWTLRKQVWGRVLFTLMRRFLSSSSQPLQRKGGYVRKVFSILGCTLRIAHVCDLQSLTLLHRVGICKTNTQPKASIVYKCHTFEAWQLLQYIMLSLGWMFVACMCTLQGYITMQYLTKHTLIIGKRE